MKYRSGFTLIELLIVAAVFSMTALVATTVVTRIQTTQRQILGKQRLVADGRYVLETLARAVRQGSIDYGYYTQAAGGGTTALRGPQNVLAVINQTGPSNSAQYLCFRLQGNILQSTAGTTSCSAASTWNNITPADVIINNFAVWVTPRSDPFAPTPRENSDCANTTPSSTSGFDQASGTCLCQQASIFTDCFPDQKCMSINSPGYECNDFIGETCTCQNANIQPEVTIMIGTDTNSQAAGKASSHTNLQTTVTSHVYRR